MAAPSVMFPGALYRPVSYTGEAGPMRGYQGWVLHVVVGNGSPFNTFQSARSPNRRFSHLWVAKDGRVEQYQKLDRQSWAQVGGNPRWWSVETEGYETEPLTGKQIETLGRWHAWCGAADLVASSPSGRGIGTHSMGGKNWGGHECPGSLRSGQRSAIIEAAKAYRAGGTEQIGFDDMGLDDVVYKETNGVDVTVRMCLRGAYKTHLFLGEQKATVKAPVGRPRKTAVKAPTGGK